MTDGGSGGAVDGGQIERGRGRGVQNVSSIRPVLWMTTVPPIRDVRCMTNNSFFSTQ